MKQRIFLTLTMLLGIVLVAVADGEHFTYDNSAYHAKTIIYVDLVDASGQSLANYDLKLGAFIGGECRYEASLEKAYDVEGNPYTFYRLVVGGDDGSVSSAASEKGQNIQLKVFRPEVSPTGANGDTGFEYLIEGTKLVFQGDYTYGEPTDPIKVTFDPLTEIYIHEGGMITIHRNQPVDILSFVQNPDGKTIPSIEWTVTEYGSDFLTLDGTTLTGTKIQAYDREPAITWTCGSQSGDIRVTVDAPATNFIWNEEYFTGPQQGQLTIAIGDNETLKNVLTDGYTLEPTDATTKFYPYAWESDNTDVIFNGQGEFDVKAKGVATLTGYPNDDCGLQPKLTVKVEQPVNAIRLGTSQIYATLGSDITTLLNNIKDAAYVGPEDADNKTLQWRVDGEYVTYNQGKYIAAKLTDDIVDTYGATIYLEATDGYNFATPAPLQVVIIPVQPTAIEAVKDPLGLKYNGEQVDVDDIIYNNIKVTPDSYTAKEMKEKQMLWIRIVGNEAGEAEPMNEVIDYVDGRLTLVGAGECQMMASANVQYVDENGQMGYRTLEVSFKVVVSAGLQQLVMEDVYMTKEENVTFTVEPLPAELDDFDPTKVTVEVLPLDQSMDLSVDMPETWKTLELSVVSQQQLQWSAKAYTLGSFMVVLKYDGEEMGWGNICVRQRVHLNDGWQWIALQQGNLESSEQIEEFFGENMKEVRSEYGVTINDSKLGYWGDLWFYSYGETYKVNMNLGAEEQVYDIENWGDYLYNMAAEGTEWNPRGLYLHEGWNWIGNPFQYWQKIDDMFTEDSQFNENDIVKTKTQFATYTNGQWQPADIYVEPGQGIILYRAAAGDGNEMVGGADRYEVAWQSELNLPQNFTQPAGVRMADRSPYNWTINDRQFDDNMSMVAYVAATTDASRVTLYAFVGDECRGRGISVGDRQYITVHGQQGERVKFLVYDQVTGELRQVVGSRPFEAISGSPKAPVALYAGPVVTGIDGLMIDSNDSRATYDLQGRRVERTGKGFYIQNGRKVVVK